MAQPQKVNGIWDIYRFYETVNDNRICYPDEKAGLVCLRLVERLNGSWFIVDPNGLFVGNARVFQDRSEVYTEPAFLASYQDAEEEAIALIANVVGKPVSFIAKQVWEVSHLKSLS